MLYIEDKIDLIDSRTLHEAYLALPAFRRRAVDGYRDELSRRRAIMVYDLLLRGLKAEYGLDCVPAIEVGQFGKPRFADFPEIKFNLSHSGTVAGCVIDTREVGLDVQMLRPFKEPLAAHVLNSSELERVLGAKNRDEAFAIEWTRKESYVKLLGVALGFNPAHLLDGVDHTCEFSTTVSADGAYVATVCRHTAL